MKLRLLLGVLLASAIPALTLAQAKDQAKTVTVNGKPIPISRVDFIVKQEVARGAKDVPQLRQGVVDQMINNEVVVQEAERKGVTKHADVQAQLDLARRQVIFQAFLEDYFKAHPIKDEAVHAEYDRVKSQKEYKARHILVDKDADAKAIIDKLKKGEKFEDLAKESKDVGNKDKGGDLGWALATNYVKPFADALVKLQKGQTTDTPVQSPFGWHVIRLDDVRPAQVPPYDEVKQRIVSALQQQEAQRVVRELRAKAKIEQ